MPPVTEVTLRYLREFVNQRPRDLAFDAGLSTDEVGEVERAHSIAFPPDLRMFLSLALPVSDGFPNWRSATFEELEAWLDRPREGVCFDIEHNGFWYEPWGKKPSDIAEACATARSRISEAPNLIPVYGHRFIPDDPLLAGNPVLSVQQTDVVYYGGDLCAYLEKEFRAGLQVPKGSPGDEPRPIRFWTDLIYRRHTGGL